MVIWEGRCQDKKKEGGIVHVWTPLMIMMVINSLVTVSRRMPTNIGRRHCLLPASPRRFLPVRIDQSCGQFQRKHIFHLRALLKQFNQLASYLLIIQGHRVYYQRIVVESSDGEKEAVLVKCGWMPTANTKNQQQQKRTKRQELSEDFQEDE